jgi:hypothetical protein
LLIRQRLSLPNLESRISNEPLQYFISRRKFNSRAAHFVDCARNSLVGDAANRVFDEQNVGPASANPRAQARTQ